MLQGIVCLDLSFSSGNFAKYLEEPRRYPVSQFLCRMDVIPRFAISVVVIVCVRAIEVGFAALRIQLNSLVELRDGRIVCALLPKDNPTIAALDRFVIAADEKQTDNRARPQKYTPKRSRILNPYHI